MKNSPLILDTKPVSYFIGEGALSHSLKVFENFTRFIILLDENVRTHCLPILREKVPAVAMSDVICIESGENKKNLDQAVYIWNELTRLNVDRDALIINLGGGVITDIGGFAAATFKRGIQFVNFPTTVLGMVDAAIGGKTGIDFEHFKNQVGLFVDPVSVIIDPIFLDTLEDKQWQSGFAEILKYGLIIDRDLWRILYGKKYREIDDLNKVIIKAARDKIDIVKHDFKEIGIRKNLNFGHTIGHAFESHFLLSGYPVTHGQAIAAGMICEAWLSCQLFEFDTSQLDEIVEMIDANFQRLDVNESHIPQLLNLMRQDKKVRRGKLNFSLLKKIGKALHNVEVQHDLVVECLKFYINK